MAGIGDSLGSLAGGGGGENAVAQQLMSRMNPTMMQTWRGNVSPDEYQNFVGAASGGAWDPKYDITPYRNSLNMLGGGGGGFTPQPAAPDPTPQQQPSGGGGGGFGGYNPYASQGWWSTFERSVGPEAAQQWVAAQGGGGAQASPAPAAPQPAAAPAAPQPAAAPSASQVPAPTPGMSPSMSMALGNMVRAQQAQGIAPPDWYNQMVGDFYSNNALGGVQGPYGGGAMGQPQISSDYNAFSGPGLPPANIGGGLTGPGGGSDFFGGGSNPFAAPITPTRVKVGQTTPGAFDVYGPNQGVYNDPTGQSFGDMTRYLPTLPQSDANPWGVIGYPGYGTDGSNSFGRGATGFNDYYGGG
jgi:hypothetical protein